MQGFLAARPPLVLTMSAAAGPARPGNGGGLTPSCNGGGLTPSCEAAQALLSVLQLEGWLKLPDMRALENAHRTYHLVRDDPGAQVCARHGCEQPARSRPVGSACGPGAAWYCSCRCYPFHRCPMCLDASVPRGELRLGMCARCADEWDAIQGAWPDPPGELVLPRAWPDQQPDLLAAWPDPRGRGL